METKHMTAVTQGRSTRRQVLKAIGSVGAVGLGGAMISSPAHAKELTIRFNHTDGRGGDGFHFAERLKTLAAERSSGRIVVQNFHSGQLGAEKDMYDSMQIGSIEMGRSGSLIISVAAPQYGALELPYVFRSQQHLRNVLAGPIGQAMHQDFLAKKGVRVLGIVNRGARHVTTKNRNVRAPADMAGLKLRVPEIPVYVAAFRALGAAPTPMAFPEVFTALQQGTIDGQENPLATINGNSFFDVQKYLVLTAHVRGNGWMVASERFWQSLAADDRKLLQQAVDDSAAFADEQIARQEGELRKTLQDKGMTVIEPDTKAFADVVLKEVPPKFADKWKPGLLDQILRTVG
jgi:tripartite ATP-independent transporter DctP family solute receptor